ncbi:phosphatidylinositol N-acetylglucosaminyltransferase subunit Q-like [Macrobrachium nipponense]|uniref:phosphatidylinositol N-acetylglucosaminyltransferase subunit Q-like n=1 Tax=Macrobrachium nipponense TaxID=159736 RepID=UPI0030C8C1DA
MSSFVATIFVPKQLEIRRPGPLYGRFIRSSGSLTDPESFVIVLSSGELQPEHIVGIMGSNLGRHQSFFRNIWLELQSGPSISVRRLSLYGHGVPLEDVTVVYYNSDEIWESELILQKYSLNGDQLSENVLPYFVECVSKEKSSEGSEKGNVSHTVVFIEVLIYIMTFIPYIIIRNIHSILQSKVDYTSSALQQIIYRISQLEKITFLLKSRRRTILNGRLITMIFVDVFCGITVAYFIGHHASVNDMYDTFCSWTKVLSSCVQDLLEWLSGAPAGLKLNQPLTQALSAFFSYHVHLWRLYLELADPLLKALAWILVWLGMFGLSIQVAILSDLLDLATLHLYCFYVYAARIHMLQISLLGSQWRAFRGRKWNPLKLRIDSDTGKHMSLKRVLTAVVFTLVIFLLPTTTVYYLVFVALRVSLSALRGILTSCIWLLNFNPVYIVVLNLMGSNRIKGEICLQVCKNFGDQQSSILKFNLYTWPTPVSEALKYARCEVLPSPPSLDWKSVLSSVVFGKDLL